MTKLACFILVVAFCSYVVADDTTAAPASTAAPAAAAPAATTAAAPAAGSTTTNPLEVMGAAWKNVTITWNNGMKKLMSSFGG